MTTCATCHIPNADGADFCAGCGAYLRWEVSGAVEALPPPAAAPPPLAAPPAAAPPPPAAPGPPPAAAPARPAAPARDPEPVVLLLRRPEEESATGRPVRQTVDPGARIEIFALIRNQSGIVDNYDISVQGLPDEWWSVAPATVYLVPFGSRATSGYEQEVSVHLHPPRSPEAEAREWPVRVVVTSRAQSAVAAVAEATLTIRPYRDLEIEMRPERRAGRCVAGFAVAVRNTANAPVDVLLSGADPDSTLAFEFDQPQLRSEPGRRAGSKFRVRPPRQTYIGRPNERRFEVTARPTDTEDGGQIARGVFVQRAWLPWWIPIAAALVAVAASFVWTTFFNKTTVPDLRGQVVFDAQGALQERGLELGSREDRPIAGDDTALGTIVEQTPAPGEEVDEGTVVSVIVAVSDERGPVPNIVGMTLEGANATLRDADFVLGKEITPPADRKTSTIENQYPEPDRRVPLGTPVDVSFAAAPTTDPGVTVVEPPDDQVSVPAIAPGLAADQAAQALVAAGFVPALQPVVSETAPAGTVIATDPPAGARAAPGSEIGLVVSSGFPTVVFDQADGDDLDILEVSGVDGTPVRAVVETDAVEGQPSLDPLGQLLAYRREDRPGNCIAVPGTPPQGRIFVIDRASGGRPRPVTDRGFDDRRPAISPDGRTIAFVSNRRATGDPCQGSLCFQGVDAAGEAPRCVHDDAYVSRPTWSPDGRMILVTARDPVDVGQVELLLYRSDRPNSGRAGDWSAVGLVTDGLHGHEGDDIVGMAAWSPDPDAPQVALTANWAGGESFVYLAPVRPDGTLGRARGLARIRGCEVGWRADGRELLVAQRDAACQASAQIVRVAPDDPSRQHHLTQGESSNPVFAPIPLP